MEESIATPVAEKVVERLFTLIERHVGYLWNYRSNISDVTQQIEKLSDGRVRMQQSVDEANRQGDEVFPDVEKWLSRAKEMIKETDKFIADERKANRGCFHLKLRYQHSKKAKKQAGDIVTEIQEADNLIKKGVARRPPPHGIGFSSIRGNKVFKSREKTFNQIMEALRDDGIMMIGVWGMGGVGKTTLVLQVAKQAKEEKLFDTMVMASNISQTPNVTKIQGEIASILGFKLEEKDEPGRAVRLSQSLEKRKKILVILDDIWEPISFETIGIPYGSDKHPKSYCKVLLTSRVHEVLSKDMGTHRDFHVQHLCEEEAWILFQNTVGDSVEKPELQHLATEVVEKCEGLPVAIMTVAKALKGESVGVWSNALEELRRAAPTNIRGVSKNVYSCLELSYNHLESEEVKLVFLLCGLLGNDDISLDDLLKYVMGLDLFDYMDSLEKARDKVVTLVKILKESSLLLHVVEDKQIFSKPPSLYFVAEEGNEYVRMHDVIRDVARSIASKDPHRFMVNKDISFQERVHELQEGLACPKLELFLYDNYYVSLRIPDTFFQEMKEVRVLCLSAPNLAQLPSSLQYLSNLRTLCLQEYRYLSSLKDIAMVGELKKLQILSFVGYKLEKLPESMKQLTDLRMLSLRHCQASIPRNVISSLSQLEHLCLRNISYRWDQEREGVEGGERIAWFSELKNLSRLWALEVDISDLDVLPEDASFDNLTRYDIFIGYQSEWDVRKNTSRGLKFKKVKGPHLVSCFSKLFKTIEVLDLSLLDDVEHFVNELDCYGFLHLKYLSVYWSDALQYIMNTTMEMECVDPPPRTCFPLLEELMLTELNKLEAVCHGPIPVGCFVNLRVMIIERCHSLKCVLWLSTAQGRESILEFPQMRQLELSHLPNMVDFYSTGISTSQEPLIIPFFNQQIAVPMLEILQLESMESVRTMWHNKYPVSWCFDLKKLCLRKCENLQTVFPSDFLEGLQSLQTLKISNCRSLKEIFEIDNINVVPPWKKLSLHSQNPQGYLAFQNLKSLEVDICHSLKYLFLTSVAKGLEQLEVLHIINCEVLEEIVVNENGPEAEPPKFLFHRLSSLELRGLRQLKRFYEQDMYTLGCPLLKILEVYNCGDMELLFQGKSLQDHEVHKQPLFLVNKDTFPIVEELKLRLRGTMEIWGGQFSRESFGKLRKLEIEDSPNISVVIPSRMLQILHNLKQLTLRSCNSVKEVIQVEGVVQYETLLLPQLTEMHLEDLPMLTHLVGFGTFGIGSLQLLQNLHHLHVSECGKLINIVSPSMAKRLVQLKKLSITACSMVKEIVGDDDDTCFSNNAFAFPSLEEMEVKELPRLTHLYNKIPGLGHNLEKLRILEISSCGKLEILFTLSLAKTLAQLEKLTVGGCYKVKEIVENEGGGDEATDVHEIIFTKLRELDLSDLPILKSFCSATYTFIFPCLTDMSVIECPEMEYFCKGDSITEMLEGVKAGNFLSYWENNLNATIQKMFMEVKEHPKEEDSQETIPDDQEGPEEEDFEGGSGSLRQRSS